MARNPAGGRDRDRAPEREWRLFADLAERAGRRRVSVRVDADADPVTVDDALGALLAAHPDLAERVLADDGRRLQPSITVLHDGDPAEMDDRVAEGEELALLPPASGG